MNNSAIRILLELEAEEDSLTGRVLRLEPGDSGWACVADRATHQFSGWLGLLNALEELVPRPPPQG